MGRSRRERTWPEPTTTRHAWVRDGSHPHDVPRQVLIIRWDRRAGRYWALIVDVVSLPGSDGSAVVHRWVPKEQLMPVPAQLNKTYGLR